jgi:endonuclease/exonuclease/phosphatase (EEP) superfamily protein YafD
MATASENREKRPSQPAPLLVRLLVALVAACTAIVILFTVCGFFGRSGWRLEQLSHFRVQYFWLLAASGCVLVLAGRRKLALAAAIAAAVNLAMIVPLYWPAGTQAGGGDSVGLVAFNLLGRNQRHAEVMAYLREQDADIVLLMEVQPHWKQQIESLNDIYPHQHVVPRPDNFGIALLSKTAWTDVRTEFFGSEVPSIAAQFELDGRPWMFIGTHPVPPGSQRAAAARNEQLATIGDFAGQQTMPVVVAGDLNLTNFSPYFRDLLAAGRLRDSRQGFGVQASWQPRLPLVAIPLDHCLISRQWHVSERRVGPHLGSDHRPVIASLNWAMPPGRLPSLE